MAASHLVFLPGLLCDSRVWKHQTAACPLPCSVADLTRHDNFCAMAGAVLSESPDRFAIAGFSMGGILALEMLRQAPERITHVALIDTNPHADDNARRAERQQQITAVLAGGLRSIAVEALKPLYLGAASANDDEILDIILAMALDLGPVVFERQSLSLMNRQDAMPGLADVRCPTLIMCGREDVLCPVGYHCEMASAISGSTLEVVNDCGHFAPMEQPDVVNQQLWRHLGYPSH